MFIDNNSYKILNGFHLKMIALITMIIDHLGVMFFPDIYGLRIIGRIAFILYCFMLVEGFLHTKDLNKYLFKVLLWAFLSEIPFDLAMHNVWFYPNEQNVFFTLFLGLMGMKVLKNVKGIKQLILIITLLITSFIFKVDYSWYGVLIILCFYYFSKSNIKFVSVEALNMLASFKLLKLQFFGFLGFIPIVLYNGKRGRKIGDIYYSFYAIHLLLFAMIKFWIC